MQAGFPRPSRWDPICISLAEQPCRHASEATSLHWSGDCVGNSVFKHQVFSQPETTQCAENNLTSSNFQSLDRNQWRVHAHTSTLSLHTKHVQTLFVFNEEASSQIWNASAMVGKKILGTSCYSYMFKKEGRLNKLAQHFSAGWLPPTFPVRPYLH